jgi:hypothetical protein
MRIFLSSTAMVLALTAPTLAKDSVTSMEIGKYNKVLCANEKGGETFTFGEKNTRAKTVIFRLQTSRSAPSSFVNGAAIGRNRGTTRWLNTDGYTAAGP